VVFRPRPEFRRRAAHAVAADRRRRCPFNSHSINTIGSKRVIGVRRCRDMAAQLRLLSAPLANSTGKTDRWLGRARAATR
jgi:hypothetical protein